MRMTDADYKAKSIHIFAWPFTWSGKDNKELDIDELARQLKEKHQWVDAENAADDYNDYMLKQYMTESARQIFLQAPTNTDSICTRLKKTGIDDYAYHIEKEGKSVDLPISGIELHLYRYGYGVLFIRADNKSSDISTIKWINDYGRRIELPLLVKEKDDFSLCADKIGIWQVDENMKLIPDEPAPFLRKVIVGEDTDWRIESTEDDRMFLMCLIRNEEISGKLKEFSGENEEEDTPTLKESLSEGVKKFFEKQAAGEAEASKIAFEKLLYTVIFADPDTPTCTNPTMRRKLLEEAIDPRWSGSGTIHAATNSTLFCLTGESKGINESVVKPFIVEYMYLLSLVMAQRLGIAHFSELAGRRVVGADQKALMQHEQVNQLVNLQEQYVAFENQMMILKFTNQDQGIELYQILQKQLQVKDEQQLLDSQLESLYEITNVSNGNRFQAIGTALAVIAVFADILINIVASLATTGKCWTIVGYVSFGVLIVLFLLFFKRKWPFKNALDKLLKRFE